MPPVTSSNISTASTIDAGREGTLMRERTNLLLRTALFCVDSTLLPGKVLTYEFLHRVFLAPMLSSTIPLHNFSIPPLLLATTPDHSSLGLTSAIFAMARPPTTRDEAPVVLRPRRDSCAGLLQHFHLISKVTCGNICWHNGVSISAGFMDGAWCVGYYRKSFDDCVAAVLAIVRILFPAQLVQWVKDWYVTLPHSPAVTAENV